MYLILSYYSFIKYLLIFILVSWKILKQHDF